MLLYYDIEMSSNRHARSLVSPVAAAAVDGVKAGREVAVDVEVSGRDRLRMHAMAALGPLLKAGQHLRYLSIQAIPYHFPINLFHPFLLSDAVLHSVTEAEVVSELGLRRSLLHALLRSAALAATRDAVERRLLSLGVS